MAHGDGRSRTSLVRPGWLRTLGAVVLVAALSGTAAAAATPPIRAHRATALVAASHSQWRAEMKVLDPVGHGCFTASYPVVQWTAEACATPPPYPFAPRTSLDEPVRGHAAPHSTGAGTDPVASTSGSFSTVTGSFPVVSSTTTEVGQFDGSGPQYANTYSIQLNTNIFTSPICNPSPNPSCRAWEQFVYVPGYVFIQYWIINYSTGCPSGWNTYSSDCWRNSADGANVSGNTVPVNELNTAFLTGDISSGNDSSIFVSENGAGADVEVGDPVGLISHWSRAEFNVLGDAGGGEAIFGANSSLQMQITTNDGTLSAPSCAITGFTAESNNLSLSTAPTESDGPLPALFANETNAVGAGPESCNTYSGTGAPSLRAPSNAIYPGTLQAFPGSLTSAPGTVTLADIDGSTSLRLVHWESTGVIVWIPPGTPTGEYTLVLTEDGAAVSVPITISSAAVAGEFIRPLFQLLSPSTLTSLALDEVHDNAGDTWFTDGANNAVDEVTTSGVLRSYPLLVASGGPTGLAIDAHGNVWIGQSLVPDVTELTVAAAHPNTTDGEKTFPITGEGVDGITVDPAGNVWFAEGPSGLVGEISAAPPHHVDEWNIGGAPIDVVADQLGNVWVSDATAGIDHVVPSELPAPTTVTVVTSGVFHVGGATPVGAHVDDLAVAPNGDVWFSQTTPSRLGVILPSATNPASDVWDDAANYVAASGTNPTAISVDASGHVFVLDPGIKKIGEFTVSGSVQPSHAVSGSWTTHNVGTSIASFPGGDESNSLSISAAGALSFPGYVTNESTDGTPYDNADVQGYLAVLPGVAVGASHAGLTVTNGHVTRATTIGTGGDTLAVPAATTVTVTGIGSFTGTVTAPTLLPSYVVPSPNGHPVGNATFVAVATDANGATVEPHFSHPLTVRYLFALPRGVTASAASHARVWAYNATTGTWDEAGLNSNTPGGTVVVTGHAAEVTIDTSQLSPFALLIPAAATPIVTAVQPSTGHAGTVVTVRGAHFGAPRGTLRVTLDSASGTATAVTVHTWSASDVSFVVPGSLHAGRYSVQVITAAGVLTNAATLTVT